MFLFFSCKHSWGFSFDHVAGLGHVWFVALTLSSRAWTEVHLTPESSYLYHVNLDSSNERAVRYTNTGIIFRVITLL